MFPLGMFMDTVAATITVLRDLHPHLVVLCLCFPADTLLDDFLLTYTVFMTTDDLCQALLRQYP